MVIDAACSCGTHASTLLGGGIDHVDRECPTPFHGRGWIVLPGDQHRRQTHQGAVAQGIGMAGLWVPVPVSSVH